jgi:hypothetical protein
MNSAVYIEHALYRTSSLYRLFRATSTEVLAQIPHGFGATAFLKENVDVVDAC